MTKLITRSYQGMTFSFREDGYFNMTKAAAHFGKQLQHFWNSPDTRDYRAALQELNTSDSDEFPRDHYTKIGRGGGTFAHPKLAIFFARWLDVRFSVWCDAMIEDILSGKAEVVVTKPETSAIVQVSSQSGMTEMAGMIARMFAISQGEIEVVKTAQAKQVNSNFGGNLGENEKAPMFSSH